MAAKYKVRSISLPARSHPTTLAVEQELRIFRASDVSSSPSTSASICSGLTGLEQLYRCADDLLNLSSTKQILSKNQKYMDQLLDGSFKLLDVCGIARDLMSQISQLIRPLQSALRRRKSESSVETEIANYISFRKTMKKEVKKLIAALKHIDTKIGGAPIEDEDHQLSAVIRVLGDINSSNISIFQSLLSYLSAPVNKSKQSRWSLVSKLMHKGAVGCEETEANVNELEMVDVSVCGHKFESAYERLEALDSSVEGLERCLESVFRQLIKTQSSLLNIISQ